MKIKSIISLLFNRRLRWLCANWMENAEPPVATDTAPKTKPPFSFKTFATNLVTKSLGLKIATAIYFGLLAFLALMSLDNVLSKVNELGHGIWTFSGQFVVMLCLLAIGVLFLAGLNHYRYLVTKIKLYKEIDDFERGIISLLRATLGRDDVSEDDLHFLSVESGDLQHPSSGKPSYRVREAVDSKLAEMAFWVKEEEIFPNLPETLRANTIGSWKARVTELLLSAQRFGVLRDLTPKALYDTAEQAVRASRNASASGAK